MTYPLKITIINFFLWPMLWLNYLFQTKFKGYPEGYLEFMSNIDIIDAKIEMLCPTGTHSEWDSFPIVETDGIREDHAYNCFSIYFKDKHKIIFELEMKIGIDKHCEDIRKENHKKIMSMDFREQEEHDNYLLRKMGIKKRLPPLEPYKEKTFEEQRFWIKDDNYKFKQAISRLEFFNSLNSGEIDYYNFKMEELILRLI